jgi:hypothetical protein
MATAETLRATYAVDERVRGVTEQVVSVDDKVAEVVRGACITFRRSLYVFNPELLRRK